MADLTYSSDGVWTSFHPHTKAGQDAWNTMFDQTPDGIVKFLPSQVPGVISQLRAAGYTVRKGGPKKTTDAEVDALLKELDL